MIKSQVVKSRSSSECEADEVVFSETALIPDASHYLRGSNVMLDLYSDGGDIPVEFPLRLVKDATLWFLERHEYRSLRLIPDIGGILIQNPVLRYRVGHVRELLVMDAAADRLADKQNYSEHTGHYRVLDRMPFFLPAVFIFLILRIYRSWNLPFGAVMKEYVRPVSAVQIIEKPLEGGIVGYWHFAAVIKCLVENCNQTVGPVAYLRLGHSEPVSKGCLCVVVPEYIEDETEPVFQGWKRTVFVITRGTDTHPGLAVDPVVTEILVMSLCEIRHKIIKILHADACQCPKNPRILAEIFKIHDNITKIVPFTCIRVILKNLNDIYSNIFAHNILSVYLFWRYSTLRFV